MQDYLPIILLGVAGFLAGGAYTTWKSTRVLSIALAVTAVVAVVAGIGWMF